MTETGSQHRTWQKKLFFSHQILYCCAKITSVYFLYYWITIFAYESTACAHTRCTSHDKFVVLKQSHTAAITMRSTPVPPVPAQSEVCLHYGNIVSPTPFTLKILLKIFNIYILFICSCGISY